MRWCRSSGYLPDAGLPQQAPAKDTPHNHSQLWFDQQTDDKRQRPSFGTDQQLDILVEHFGAVDPLDDVVAAGVFELRARHLDQLPVHRHDEVSVQHELVVQLAQSCERERSGILQWTMSKKKKKEARTFSKQEAVLKATAVRSPLRHW